MRARTCESTIDAGRRLDVTSALIILTGSTTWTMKDGTPHPTGYWAREFMEAYNVFTGGGLDVDVATPGGVGAQVDELSYALGYNDNDPDYVARQKTFLDGLDDVLGAPLKLEDVRPGQYDVLFIVGGHGPMQDLAVHPTIGDVLAANLDSPNGIVGGVCHGPAGFLSAHRADGTWLFKGRRLTAFTNEEETGASFAGNAPWLLEDRLRLAGAHFEAAPAWTTHVVVDGNLVTGQQNVSSGAAATEILDQLTALAQR
jgi:putative intracellular protease/amidase